jgi:hypothetical protein
MNGVWFSPVFFKSQVQTPFPDYSGLRVTVRLSEVEVCFIN